MITSAELGCQETGRKSSILRIGVLAALSCFGITRGQDFAPTRLSILSITDAIQIEILSSTGQLTRLEISEDLLNWRTAAVMLSQTGTNYFFQERRISGAQFFRASRAEQEGPLSAFTMSATSGGSITFTDLTDEGGTITRGSALLNFRPGEIAGSIRAAIVPGVAQPMTSPTWTERIRRVSEPFAVVARGDGVIRGGRVALNFDPAQIPEGWEPQVLVTSTTGRAAPILANIPTTGAALTTPRARTAEEETRYASDLQQLVENGPAEQSEPESRVPTFSSFVCAERTAPGRLETPLVAGDAPGLTELYELVLARKIQNNHLQDERGRDIGCVFFLRAPPHGKDQYLRRLETALRKAISHARRMGIPDPPFPISITVVDELRDGPGAFAGQLQGTTSGTRMALRSDLMAQWPLGVPGQLEYTVTHEYFHVLQAFALSLATYNDNKNNWALEGGAEWFAHSLYDNFSEDWPAPVSGFEAQTSYNAAPFWMYLQHRFGSHVMTECLDLLRGAALGGRQFNDISLQIAFGLRMEIYGFTEALDRVLRRRGASLSEVYGDFAAAYLYRRDFSEGDQGTGAHPGLWYGLYPFEFPVENAAAWSEKTLMSATTNYPIVVHNLTIQELSASAIRFVDRFDRGRLHLTIESPKVFLSSLEPSFCRELGAPKIRLFVYGERQGTEPELVHDLTVSSNGVNLTVESVGRGGRYESVAVILANTAWRIRRDCTESSSERLETGIGTVSYRLRAYVDEREANTVPTATHVRPPAGGKRWTVSKIRSFDEEGKPTFGTFAAAINNPEVENLNEIVADPDTYEEQILITKSLFIRARIPGTATIKFPGQVVSFGTNDATLANFVLIGGGNTVPVVGGIKKAHGSRVLGNIIVSRGLGIRFFESSGHVIERNWIAARQGGIDLVESTGVSISENTIAPPYLVDSLQEPVVTGKRVETPNSYEGVIGAAISLWRCSSILVAYNESLTWNWFATGSFDEGLSAYEVNGLTVTSNLFRTDSGNGLGLLLVTNAVVAGNTVAGHQGIVLQDANEVTLRGNIAEGVFEALRLQTLSSAAFQSNHFIAGRTSWAVSGKGVTGLNSQGDHIDGLPGGGAGFSGGSARLFFQGTTFRGRDTACELVDTPTTTFLDCTFVHAERKDQADKPGDGGGLIGRASNQILLRGAHFVGPNIAVDIRDGVHPAWENLEIEGEGALGIYATGTTLNLRDVVIHPNVVYPFGAREGNIQMEQCRFAYAEGSPLTVLPRLEISQGLLQLDELTSKQTYVFTSLTPWWWVVRTQFGGDYHLKLTVDLDTVDTPTQPLFDQLHLASVFWEPPYYDGNATVLNDLVKEVRTEIEYNATGRHNSTEFGIVAVPPDAAYP